MIMLAAGLGGAIVLAGVGALLFSYGIAAKKSAEPKVYGGLAPSALPPLAFNAMYDQDDEQGEERL
jgi:hypothetical protein